MTPARFACGSPPTERLVGAGELRLSELIGAMSVALDITSGQPAGHGMRSALVGMWIADVLRLSAADRSALFYALLLKDVGCSSNAAKMAYLFGADDHVVKREAKLVDWTRAGQKIRYVWKSCAPGGSFADKLLRLGALARGGPAGERQIIQVRCERGASIARELQFPEATATAIRALDEHWNGKGHPAGLRGNEIPLLGRICCLAQTVEVFHATYGRDAALEMAAERRGRWFDPQLVDALFDLRNDQAFWTRLHAPDLAEQVKRAEPQDTVYVADEACLDRSAEAFAKVVDAKSPWTYRHSTRVAEIAVCMAGEFGCSDGLVRDIRRAALLHDIGKLGVSNLILDKPDKLTAAEFVEMRKHPDYTQQIIERIGVLRTLADVASAHHERLDGRGYHRQLNGRQLHWVSRLLTVADVYEAMSARRPYRDELPWEQIQRIMADDAGKGIDPECFAALERVHEQFTIRPRVEAQLVQVEHLLAEVG